MGKVKKVLANCSQTLTDAEKAQARDNIGAGTGSANIAYVNNAAVMLNQMTIRADTAGIKLQGTSPAFTNMYMGHLLPSFTVGNKQQLVADTDGVIKWIPASSGAAPTIYQSWSRSISSYYCNVSAGGSMTQVNIVLNDSIVLPAHSTVLVQVTGNNVWGKTQNDVGLGRWWGPRFVLDNVSSWAVQPNIIDATIPYQTSPMGSALGGCMIGKVGDSNYDLTSGIRFCESGVFALESGGGHVYACGITMVTAMIWPS